MWPWLYRESRIVTPVMLFHCLSAPSDPTVLTPDPVTSCYGTSTGGGRCVSSFLFQITSKVAFMESSDVPCPAYRDSLVPLCLFSLCFFSDLFLFSLRPFLVSQAHEVSRSNRWMLWACFLRVGKAELGRGGKVVPVSVSHQTSVQMLSLRSKAALTPCSLIL